MMGLFKIPALCVCRPWRGFGDSVAFPFCPRDSRADDAREPRPVERVLGQRMVGGPFQSALARIAER